MEPQNLGSARPHFPAANRRGRSVPLGPRWPLPAWVPLAGLFPLGELFPLQTCERPQTWAWVPSSFSPDGGLVPEASGASPLSLGGVLGTSSAQLPRVPRAIPGDRCRFSPSRTEVRTLLPGPGERCDTVGRRFHPV